jgi:hypothetical protein
MSQSAQPVNPVPNTNNCDLERGIVNKSTKDAAAVIGSGSVSEETGVHIFFMLLLESTLIHTF